MSMIKLNETLRYKNCNYKRVNKTKAKNAFKNGTIVYLLPSNLNLNSEFVDFCTIDKGQGVKETFETLTSSFYYYNCNSETGNQIDYYLYIWNPSTIKNIILNSYSLDKWNLKELYEVFKNKYLEYAGEKCKISFNDFKNL